MSEVGPSLSEIKPTNSPQGINPKSAPDIPSSKNPRERQGLLGRLRSLGLKFISEQDFRPEDYTTDAIARDIAKYLRNPLLERAGRNPYANGFGIKDLLSNKGQVRVMGNPDSPAYRSAAQALHALTRDGVLELNELDQPHDGEWRRYYVTDPEKLLKAGEPTQETQS